MIFVLKCNVHYALLSTLYDHYICHERMLLDLLFAEDFWKMTFSLFLIFQLNGYFLVVLGCKTMICRLVFFLGHIK